ncbi:unnamed protein product [Brugia pahangi]|uniref:C2H2-type domain-containing protein n=1 Tax=Brugia pahangi TaxID=6280 RepID=A0A0N4TUZ6_BRUPA|nr:unnamed protein product [Brugia pahangi]
MNAKCPVVGEHLTMNQHFTITYRRMNLVLSARTVANSSPIGMHCKNTSGSAKQNLVNERRYECLYPGCATVTKSYKEYIAHRKTHGQPFIYECRVAGCGRTFHHDSTLYYHKQTHEPHPQCERCGNFFHSMTVLCRHKRLCQIKSR